MWLVAYSITSLIHTSHFVRLIPSLYFPEIHIKRVPIRRCLGHVKNKYLVFHPLPDDFMHCR